ncbi:MAG TPA: S26 family signal peptidase, partial [Thermoanaerobaculia bacterium]|nr:S26 family signal peptidase [Thermoanaerobaculia bacterium]
GDSISLEPAGVSINGQLLRGSAPLLRDRRGRTLFPTTFRGRLQPSQIWVHAPHPRSWDSRYHGPLPSSAIVSTLKPLLVFP